jgi:hypothetical protein
MQKLLAPAMFLFLGLISSCCREGTNGDATVVVFPKHHGVPVNNHVGYPDSVYVKFNTKDLPGTRPEDFDVIFVGEGREDHVHCPNLKCGNYYFYVTGYDSASNSRVVGGMHVKVKHKERKNEIVLEASVSE